MSDRFDPDTHTYWSGERRLSSVTEVLRPIIDYSMVPEAALELARDRGTAVHLAAHLDDLNDLNEASVAPEVAPRLAAYRKFKREYDAEVVISEEPIYYPAIGLAGTPDKYLIVRKPGTRKRVRVCADLKNVSQMSAAIGVQLGGYELLLTRVKNLPVDERWGLQLKSNGTYQIYPYDQEQATFMSLLTLQNWRLRNAA